jgi:L-lactate dehydrogenase (cytochrome)
MSGGAGFWSKLRGGLLSYLLHPAWTLDVGVGGRPHVFGNLTEYAPHATTPADFTAWTANQFDPSADWSDVAWLRREWAGTLIIKGVLTPEDSRAAFEAGADAVVVSNHGGRQLDGVASTIEALPRIVDALKSAAPVFVDSGVRSGLDVLRARALGADAVLIGRPWVYAVAARGEAGLFSLLSTFESELRVGMALTGCARLAEAGPALIDR